jgi:putative transcriptional regulator
MIDPGSGIMLISDPFLKDPNFMRTVVLLCEHNPDGSFGFVLNRPFKQRLDDFIPELEGFSIPVYYGGPVQPDSLHFIHSLPHLIPEGQPVGDGIFWGGNFQQVIELIRQRDLDLDCIRFFLGYSGWSTGQLDDELNEKSWLTVEGKERLVFHSDPDKIWKEAVKELDEAFHEIINYPIDPQLN